MAKQKLHITTTRMLKLFDHMIERKLVNNQGEACEKIGLHRANLTKVKAGTNKFTLEQIEAACKITGASADYVFGFTLNMTRKPARKAVDLLKQAIAALETGLG